MEHPSPDRHTRLSDVLDKGAKRSCVFQTDVLADLYPRVPNLDIPDAVIYHFDHESHVVLFVR